MKGRNIIWTGLIALVIGVLMIIYHRTLLTRDIVVGCGILFIIAGIINLTLFLSSRDSQGRPSHNAASMVVGWIASAAAVVLGLSMVIFQTTFVALVAYMFAFLLLFAALFQVFLVLFGARPARLSAGWFVIPTALTGVAIYIFLQRPTIDDHVIMLATGIALGVFGIASIIEGGQIGAINRAARHRSNAPETADATSAQLPAAQPEDTHTTTAAQPDNHTTSVNE